MMFSVDLFEYTCIYIRILHKLYIYIDMDVYMDKMHHKQKRHSDQLCT